MGNLACVESAVRHLQYTEHEVKKRSEAKKTPDSSEYFLGRHKRTGGALICPDLLKWVSERASRDANILKEQRKVTEERALAKPKNKGGKE